MNEEHIRRAGPGTEIVKRPDADRINSLNQPPDFLVERVQAPRRTERVPVSAQDRKQQTQKRTLASESEYAMIASHMGGHRDALERQKFVDDLQRANQQFKKQRKGKAKHPILHRVKQDCDDGHNAVVVTTALWSHYLRKPVEGAQPIWATRFGLVLVDEASQATEAHEGAPVREMKPIPSKSWSLPFFVVPGPEGPPEGPKGLFWAMCALGGPSGATIIIDRHWVVTMLAVSGP